MPGPLSLVNKSAADRTRVFTLLALNGGDYEETAAMLGVTAPTVRKWATDRWEDYERIRRELAPRIEDAVVAQMREFVVRLHATKMLALERTHAALAADEIPAQHLGRTLQALATSQAIAVDKVMLLTGRPQQVVEHRSTKEIMARLEQLGAVVDGTAVELPTPAGELDG